MSSLMLQQWIKAQKPLGPAAKDVPLFYRNLEEALDVRRKDHIFYTLKKHSWKDGGVADFSSNDILALGSSSALREEFMQEFERNPNELLGAGGSRVLDGNYGYLETVEDEIASFHGAETGLMVASGYDANLAIFSAIPRSGDVIVYDELVHASTHDGMQHGNVSRKVSFRHNDVESFREVLAAVHDEFPLIKVGKRSIIVAVESFYSMDGDVCPLKPLVETAKSLFPLGNCQFVVDEAHSTGTVGSNGAGLVCELGLESEIAIRLHTFGKALAGAGAIILGTRTLKSALINLARSVIFTTGPSFPTVAAARAAYNLLKTGQTQERQATVQTLVRHFLSKITTSPILEEAEDLGICSIPLSLDWDQQPYLTHILPIWTRPRYCYFLSFHLLLADISVYPIGYPTVPKGQDRVRIAFHANNTEAQVDLLVEKVCEWAKEMIEIEYASGGRKSAGKLPRAARTVYSLMATDDEPVVIPTSPVTSVFSGSVVVRKEVVDKIPATGRSVDDKMVQNEHEHEHEHEHELEKEEQKGNEHEHDPVKLNNRSRPAGVNIDTNGNTTTTTTTTAHENSKKRGVLTRLLRHDFLSPSAPGTSSPHNVKSFTKALKLSSTRIRIHKHS